MNVEHTHPDPDRLVFACPACRERSLEAQRDAEVAEAPLYHVAVGLLVVGRHIPVSVELKWPSNWAKADVFRYYVGMPPGTRVSPPTPLHPALQAAVDRALSKAFPSGKLLEEAFASVHVESLIRRQLVDVPVQDPWEGHPTLFE